MIDPALEQRIRKALDDTSSGELESFHPAAMTCVLRADWRTVVADNLLAAFAQAPAAPPTCDTCQHAGTASEGTRECYHPEWNSLGIECMSVPVPFYCLLHAPRPASAAKEE